MIGAPGAGGKILFVAPSAYPVGGVQTWLDYALFGLRRHGWITELALTSGRHHNVDAYLAKHPFAQTYRVAAPTGTRQGRIDAIEKRILASRPDLVVGVNIADVYLAAARARNAGLRSLRVAATLHGFGADFLADLAAHRGDVDAIVSTNRLARRLVEELAGYEPRRALYAPCGVEAPALRPCPDARACDDGPLRLAFVGRITDKEKRVSDLLLIVLTALRSGMAIELTVAGDGPDLDAMRSEASELGVAAHIRFFGALGAEELDAQVYSAVDALIIASPSESGPLVAWEAMSRGLPVITSRFIGSGAERALIDGVNCLMFEIGDIDGAVEKLRLLAQPDVRRRLADAGPALVAQRYTIARSVAQWSEAFAAIMDLPERPMTAHPTPPPSGRLDSLFGARLSDAIRKLGGRGFAHAEPGGEWPHAYGVGALDVDTFLRRARDLDREQVCANA